VEAFSEPRDPVVDDFLHLMGLFPFHLPESGGSSQKIQEGRRQLQKMGIDRIPLISGFEPRVCGQTVCKFLESDPKGFGFQQACSTLYNRLLEEVSVSSRMEGRSEKGVLKKKGVVVRQRFPFGGNPAEQSASPSEKGEEGICLGARVGKRIHALAQPEPENALAVPQEEEFFGLGTDLPSAFLSIVDPVAEIDAVILGGMKHTADDPVTPVQIAERPAAESCDGRNGFRIGGE
jgi:hypothetical protein